MNKRIIELKNIQFKKYAFYDIKISVLEDIFSKYINLEDENQIISSFNREVEKYIINELKNDNLDLQIKVIEYHNRLKKMILMNPKYNIDKAIIDKTYEDAIELLKNRYDYSETLYTNILNNMRYILFSEKVLDSRILEQGIYDISFFNEYIKVFNIDKNTISDMLNCKVDELDDYLNSKKLITKSDLSFILKCFNVDNYEKLKEKVINSINSANSIKENKIKNDNKNDIKPITNKIDSKIDKKENTIKSKKNLQEQKEIILDKMSDYFSKSSTKSIENIPVRDLNQIKQIPAHEKKKKINVKPIVKYDLSFIKEYAQLYNLNKQQLSTKFHCGVGRVDEILDGKLLVSESFIDEIAYEFGAKNYEDLKEKIAKKIKIKKSNMIKDKSVVIEKQENKENNEVSINKINKDKLFSMLDVRNMSHRRYLITVLLFSGVVDKSIDEIADFLQMSSEYIKKVYLEDLLIVENELKKENIKLIYTKKDPINK